MAACPAARRSGTRFHPNRALVVGRCPARAGDVRRAHARRSVARHVRRNRVCDRRGGRPRDLRGLLDGRTALPAACDRSPRPGARPGAGEHVAGIADRRERAARVDADEVLAGRVERDGVDAFLSFWLAQPMFATVPEDAPGLADRRRLTPDYLAACLRRLGAGVMEPAWDDSRSSRCRYCS